MIFQKGCGLFDDQCFHGGMFQNVWEKCICYAVHQWYFWSFGEIFEYVSLLIMCKGRGFTDDNHSWSFPRLYCGSIAYVMAAS